MLKPLFYLTFIFTPMALGSDSIRTEVMEAQRRSSGETVRVERTFREDKSVLFQMKEGRRQVIVFYNDGKHYLTLSDENGDGFFEKMVVFNDDLTVRDAFTRHSETEIVPVSSEELSRIKQEYRDGLGDMLKLD